MNLEPELQELQGMLSRERLAVDECDGKRTAFLSHVGSVAKLAPGPWIAHRDLLYALALANLSQSQRHSLARAVLVEHDREFGVGHLSLEAIASGLPMGGSSLLLTPRRGGLKCLHTWSLAEEGAAARRCDWLTLRAQPEWALDEPPRPLSSHGISTLVELGGKVLVVVDTAVAAAQVAGFLAGAIAVAAHPRFSPHVESHDANSPVLLWPHDTLDSPGLARQEINTVVLVGAPEGARQQALEWARERAGVEVVEAACPGRIDRPGLEALWKASGKPKVLLRGDPTWSREGSAWLESLGAKLAAHSRATQLTLL
jgi:hypothetical protein